MTFEFWLQLPDTALSLSQLLVGIGKDVSTISIDDVCDNIFELYQTPTSSVDTIEFKMYTCIESSNTPSSYLEFSIPRVLQQRIVHFTYTIKQEYVSFDSSGVNYITAYIYMNSVYVGKMVSTLFGSESKNCSFIINVFCIIIV